MPIEVVKLPDEPIITVTFSEPVDFAEEIGPAFKQILSLRDTIHGCSRYFAVFDASAIKVSFHDVILALGEARNASRKRRPDLQLSLALVGSGGLLEMAANAMGQKQYGGYKMALFTSLDEALAAIHAQLAA
jgi:hypothetical protein